MCWNVWIPGYSQVATIADHESFIEAAFPKTTPDLRATATALASPAAQTIDSRRRIQYSCNHLMMTPHRCPPRVSRSHSASSDRKPPLLQRLEESKDSYQVLVIGYPISGLLIVSWMIILLIPVYCCYPLLSVTATNTSPDREHYRRLCLIFELCLGERDVVLIKTSTVTKFQYDSNTGRPSTGRDIY